MLYVFFLKGKLRSKKTFLFLMRQMFVMMVVPKKGFKIQSACWYRSVHVYWPLNFVAPEPRKIYFNLNMSRRLCIEQMFTRVNAFENKARKVYLNFDYNLFINFNMVIRKRDFLWVWFQHWIFKIPTNSMISILILITTPKLSI